MPPGVTVSSVTTTPLSRRDSVDLSPYCGVPYRAMVPPGLDDAPVVCSPPPSRVLNVDRAELNRREPIQHRKDGTREAISPARAGQAYLRLEADLVVGGGASTNFATS